MSGEDVYDVAKKAEEWEVGQCPYCDQGYTLCDCPAWDDDDARIEVERSITTESRSGSQSSSTTEPARASYRNREHEQPR